MSSQGSAGVLFSSPKKEPKKAPGVSDSPGPLKRPGVNPWTPKPSDGKKSILKKQVRVKPCTYKLGDDDKSIPLSAGDYNKKDAGFTVIELLIAFTILAVVSGSLFQMLFVTSRNNARAVELDISNNIAITVAELFKAHDSLDETDMFLTQDGAIAGAVWRSDGGERYVKYYDGNWNELEISLPVGGIEAIAPKDACYMLEAVLDERRAAGPDQYHISASLSLNLDSSQNHRLVINETSGGIEALFNGIPRTIDNPADGRVISVNVGFSLDGALPKYLTVANRTGYTANINVFGVPNAGASGVPDASAFASGAPSANSTIGAFAESETDANADSATGDEGAPYNRYIVVTPVSGSIGVMYFDDQARAADNINRFISVTVRELLSDGLVLAKVEASKYIPG